MESSVPGVECPRLDGAVLDEVLDYRGIAAAQKSALVADRHSGDGRFGSQINSLGNETSANTPFAKVFTLKKWVPSGVSTCR